MLYAPVIPSLPPPADPTLVGELATLAAGIDDRFLSAGATLAHAIDTIQQVITALDGVTLAIDDETAAVAVADLKAIAQRLTCLPETQARRNADLVGIDEQADTIRKQVVDMRGTLRLLSIYGPNIKIASSGEPVFLSFVDNMLRRLGQGEQHLTRILAELGTLSAGMADGRDSAAHLLAECARVVPVIPDRLERNASDLENYLSDLKALARRVAGVAREIEGRIGVALSALQIGDSTRQRLEHVVAMLTMVDERMLDDPTNTVAIAGHVRALAAAQIDALAADFEQDAERLVAALAALSGETQSLLDVIATHESGDGGHVLADLDRDVSEISDLIAQLLEADHRANAMVRMTTDAVTALADRFEGLRLIRRDVQDIAVNTRLLCRRFGVMGRAVAVIAVEVGACAGELDAATVQIAAAMDALANAGRTIAEAQRQSGGSGDRLAQALDAVRAGCGRSERGVRDGGNDARALIAALETAGGTLGQHLAMGAAIRAAGEQLTARGGSTATDLPNAADALLRDLLVRIAALYTMAAERTVHAPFLLPGMATAPVDPIDDDGLF